MAARHRRVALARAADIAIVAAFVGLSALGYDRLVAGIDALMTVPGGATFTELYRPGQNPWASVMISPPPAERLASLSSARRPAR